MKISLISNSIGFAIIALTSSSSAQATLVLELTGAPGSNIITYRAYGSITVSEAIPSYWTDPNALGNFTSRAPSGGVWESTYDEDLGDILSTYDSTLNDTLFLSNPVPLLLNGMQMDTSPNIGMGIRVPGNAVLDAIDLNPSELAGGDNIELDPLAWVIYDALSDGDTFSWEDTTGTFTLESGTFDTIFTTGTFSDPGIYDVIITEVPEPSSGFLAAISLGMFLFRRRRS